MYTYVRQNPWTHFDPEGLQAVVDGTVTAYGKGPDNAYKGHPNGGADIAHSTDPNRPKVGGNPQAHLGSGTFNDPTTVAVSPKANIPYGSKVYSPTTGWGVVEDQHSTSVGTKSFDYWSGTSTQKEQSNLTGKQNITVYKPGDTIPPGAQKQGPSTQWTQYYDKHSGDNATNVPKSPPKPTPKPTAHPPPAPPLKLSGG